MHHRNERRATEKAAVDLMTKILKSKDSINDAEKNIAKKISSDDFLGFNSLCIGEIDDLINLVGYYWDDEENNTIVFVDMLLEYRWKEVNRIESGLGQKK